jgi:hypothetical protein
MNMQVKMLKLITDYNSTDRKIIKENYKRIISEKNIKPANIMKLGFSDKNVYQWGNSAASNIPLFEQALKIAIIYNFDITEFIKSI